MTKKTLIWLGAAVFVFVFICFLMPLHMLNSAPFFWALVGAGGVGACIFMAFYQKAEYDETTIEQEAKAKVTGVGTIIAVFAGVATLFCSFFIPSGREDEYLKTHGDFASAMVMDGQSKTTKRRGSSNTTYELDLRYQVGGKWFTTTVDVGSEDWNYTGKGDKILVLYEKDHPDFCKAIISAEKYNKFVPDSAFQSIDYKKLIELYNNRTKLEPKMKALSKFWEKEMVKTATPLYSNLMTKSNVVLNDGIFSYIQIDASKEFYHILESTKKALKPVYDSIENRPSIGAAFENDSLQIRFAITSTKKERTQQNNDDNPYGIIFSPGSTQYNYLIYVVRKDEANFLLPENLDPNDNGEGLSNEKMMEKKIREIMEKQERKGQ